MKPDRSQITGLLLAAGKGTRFGGAKLDALLDGEMLGLHAARTLAGMADFRVAVTNPTSHALRAQLIDLGYRVIDNDDPDAGLSRSLSLGIAAAKGEGVLICLADMPRVTAVHLKSLITEFERRGVAVASATPDRRSPPALFPRVDWPQLMRQSGDKGARDLIRLAQPVFADPDTLIDVDTVEDMTNR